MASRCFHPSYTFQTPSGYIFRLRVPEDLRDTIGKSEFRYSLRTGAIREARQRAGCISSLILQLFKEVRRNVHQYTSEKINRLVRRYVQVALDSDEKFKSQLMAVTERPLVRDSEMLSELEEYKALNRELLGALQEVVKSKAGMIEDKTLIVASAATDNGDSKHGLTFTAAQALYCSETEKTGNWTAKTTAEIQTIFALFVRAMGDLPLSQIDRKVMSAYKTLLMQLPPNLNMLPQYKGKTLEEVIASKPAKTLSVNSINKHFRWLSGLFNHAVKHGHIHANPVDGLLIKRVKRPDLERQVYTDEDLRKLFYAPEYVNNSHKDTYGYWTPLIALYSGCRLEEICQLHLEDIRQECGVWVFDINDKHEKRLKNLSSIRLVPIHPHLIELGLVEHAQKLKARGERRLFPTLHQTRDGYGQTVSKWYQRFKRKCGIPEGKTFHSFRHTFVTHLKHKQVDPFMIHELDGHAIDSETMGRYGKRYTPEILLREAIVKIKYELEDVLHN